MGSKREMERETERDREREEEEKEEKVDESSRGVRADCGRTIRAEGAERAKGGE